MVFRCRPKPNLAAAKKAQVSKPPPSTNETEKQPALVKDNVDKKPPPTVATPGLVVKSEMSPVKAPTPSTSAHDLHETASTTGTASVTEIPNETHIPKSALVNSTSGARTEISSKTGTTLNSTIVTSIPDATQNSSGPLPSIHAVPRPPAKITGDNSLSSMDESESPLFIPQKSQMSLLSKETSSDEARPPPAVERPVQQWKAPFEPTIDLDEADNEASDEEKVQPTPPRKRKMMIEDVLSKPKQKKLRDPNIRTVPMIYGPPDRSTVKMRDLIYRHNLTEPPPQYRQEREIKQKGRRGCLWMFHNGMPDSGADPQPAQSAAASDESIKDDKSLVSNSTSSPAETKPEKAEKAQKAEKAEKAEKKPDVKPAQAQFVMDAQGNIVLNEESLVIRREYTDADYIDIKQDSFMGSATYSSYRAKRPRAKKWSVDEHVRLYKALSTIGTDFSCMVRLFKNRTREEIKRKFKREEKARPQLIDHVLSNRKSFDLSLLDNPEDDVMPIISDDTDSSSDSDEDALQKALKLDGSSKEKLCRRPKRFKRIDLDPSPIPANPTWYKSKTAYQPDPPQVRKPKPNPARACGIVEEAEAALRRARAHSLEQQQPVASPAPPPSPCPSAPGGVEDVLSRLIGQKMRDVNQRPTPPITPVLSSKGPPLPSPIVRSSAPMSLTEFCKMEAHVDS